MGIVTDDSLAVLRRVEMHVSRRSLRARSSSERAFSSSTMSDSPPLDLVFFLESLGLVVEAVSSTGLSLDLGAILVGWGAVSNCVAITEEW